MLYSVCVYIYIYDSITIQYITYANVKLCNVAHAPPR